MNPPLLSKLRHLRLSGMAEALPGRLTQATGASLPHLEFLELLVEDELNRRADRLFTRRLRQAEIVQMQGKSYRMHQRSLRQGAQTDAGV